MKTLLIRILRSFFKNPGVFLKFRDAVLSSGAEHLFRVNKFIADHGLQKKGTAIIDIGAAGGETCKWFATHFPGKKIIGFEPVHESFSKAVRLTEGLSQVKIHNVALGAENTEATVYVTSDPLASSLHRPGDTHENHMPDSQVEKVRVRHTESIHQKRLDDVVDPADDFLIIKLDTQGSELNVLNGATVTLKRTRLVLIEMSNHQLYEGAAPYHEVDAFLRQHGFRLVDIYVTYRPKGVMSEFDALYQNHAL